MKRRNAVITFLSESWDWVSVLAFIGTAVSFRAALLAYSHTTPQSIAWYALFVACLVLANLLIALTLVAIVGFLSFYRRLVLWSFYALWRSGRS